MRTERQSIIIEDRIYADVIVCIPDVILKIRYGKTIYNKDWSFIRNYLTEAFWDSVFFMRGL